MTVAQLFTRLTRPLNNKVPSTYDDEGKQYLVDAANLGLNQFTRGLPSVRLQEPRSERLVAPVTKTITATQTSKTIAFAPAWADVGLNLGRTCIVGGESAAYNRLQTATSLMNAYEGATGSTSLEVMSDAVMIGQSYEVAGDVILVDGADTFPMTYGMPGGYYPGRWRNITGVTGGDAEAAQRIIVRARPTNWWIETFNGLSGLDSPSFLLRLWPQPDKLYKINFNLRLWPTALQVADIASTTVLPIQVNEEAMFLNLCFPALFTCPLWQGTANKEDYQTAANKAVADLLGDEKNRGNQQPGNVMTKRGY